MIMNDELRELIINNAPVDKLRDAARGHGMVSLRDAGEAFMFEGVTTPDEVVRETIMEA
jgi:type IV pilus assembly protein PilB